MRRVTCITTSEYGDFEGVIPPKQYGASTVLLWDQGTWHPIEDAKAGLHRGRLRFATGTSYWWLGITVGALRFLMMFVADSFPDPVREAKQEMDTPAVPTGSYWKGEKGQKK